MKGSIERINDMKKSTLKLKYKRPTLREHGHTQVIYDQEVVGYFLPCKGLRKDQNYRLILDNLKNKYIAKWFISRKKVVDFLIKEFTKKNHTLQIIDGRKNGCT